MLAVIEDTWDPRTLAFMLEIIIIVLDTEANTRLLILGLPVFCKFNFIFFEDHSNMLKIFSFFPYVNILLLLKNIFSRIEYWVFSLHVHKKGTKMYIQQCHCVTLETTYVLCSCLIYVVVGLNLRPNPSWNYCVSF